MYGNWSATSQNAWDRPGNPDKFYIKCNNHYTKVKAPFVIYADFECLTEKYGMFSTKSKNTDAYQKHTPCGLMINVVNSITGSSESYLHRSHDCTDDKEHDWSKKWHLK